VIARTTYEREFPRTLVEILLQHGWDINHRRFRQQPLLWHMVYDGDLVEWCLERGARILADGQKPWPKFDINSGKECTKYLERFPWSDEEASEYFYDCPPILERAAGESTVATFELLRSKDAQLSWRVLHRAVSSRANRDLQKESTREQTSPTASDGVNRLDLSDGQLARTRKERMAMVRHLVDTLKLDANARDQPPGWDLGGFWGRPLHYVAHHGGLGDTREVTLFLLDHGADLDLLNSKGESPMTMRRSHIQETVHEWRSLHSGNPGSI